MVASEAYITGASGADSGESTVVRKMRHKDAKDAWRYNPNFNTEAYDRIYENQFIAVNDDPRSTFSVDVDTASYSNMRRFLNNGNLPPKDAVRVEELINYFSYKYKKPDNGRSFSVSTELSDAPWNKQHKLVHIGIKGRSVTGKMPARNLTFLLDVSGSMNSRNKLPLLKNSLKLLVNQLNDQDYVSIVVYAGASGLVLEPTRGSNKKKIINALDKLYAGGSTNGGAGIKLAYATARKNLRKNGINRVILATDGDFNVGTTNQGDLIRLIEKERESGVFLTVLGLGMGNYKDSTMEKLADKGNGNYGYIDTISEARKMLVHEAGSTLVTIAKDMKLQIEFNPAKVASYRLIGYENRILKHHEFNDDKVDAGDVGAGHTVTALYEIIPVGVKNGGIKVDPLRYQNTAKLTEGTEGEWLQVKIRYKKPTGKKSMLEKHIVSGKAIALNKTSPNYRFSAAVASFGMLLRDSKFKGSATYIKTYTMAKGSLGQDPHGYRAEFLRLVKLAEELKGSKAN